MRKSPSGSIASLTAAFESAANPPQPPAHIALRPEDRPFWDSLMQTKSATQWTPSDLEVAAQLAACRADIERLRRELAGEGDMIENNINKKHVLLDMFFKRQVALARILQVDAVATQGRNDCQSKKNETFQDAKKLHSHHADNTLIPMRR